MDPRKSTTSQAPVVEDPPADADRDLDELAPVAPDDDDNDPTQDARNNGKLNPSF
jgi:hypothetical protein